MTGQSEDDEDWLLGESMDGSRSGGFPRVSLDQTQLTTSAREILIRVRTLSLKSRKKQRMWLHQSLRRPTLLRLRHVSP